MNASSLLTIDEIANTLRKSGSQIRRWARTGQINAIKIGRTWRISTAELDRVMREGVREVNRA